MAGTSEPSEEHSGEPIEIRDSRPFYGFWCLLTGSLAGLTAFAWGWGPIGLLVFGLHSVWSFLRLFSRRARLCITEEGIVDANFWTSPGLIRWEEVLDVQPTRWGLIEVKLLDEQAFWSRQSFWAQLARAKLLLYGYQGTVIVPWGLAGSRRKLVQTLQDGLDAAEIAAMGQAVALKPVEPEAS